MDSHRELGKVWNPEFMPQSVTDTASPSRTLDVLWLLEAVLDTNLGESRLGACSGLDGLPLPSSKDLWEAGSQVEWETKYRVYLSSRKGNEPLSIGDLRRAQHVDSAAVGSVSRSEDLNTWSSSIDSFGGLLMMCIGIVH